MGEDRLLAERLLRATTRASPESRSRREPKSANAAYAQSANLRGICLWRFGSGTSRPSPEPRSSHDGRLINRRTVLTDLGVVCAAPLAEPKSGDSLLPRARDTSVAGHAVPQLGTGIGLCRIRIIGPSHP